MLQAMTSLQFCCLRICNVVIALVIAPRSLAGQPLSAVMLACRPEDISVAKLLAHARSYGIELFCPGFPGAQATQVGLRLLPLKTCDCRRWSTEMPLSRAARVLSCQTMTPPVSEPVPRRCCKIVPPSRGSHLS